MHVKIFHNESLQYKNKYPLHSEDVHIWHIDWKTMESFWNKHQYVMSEDERVRFRSYRFYEDKTRYMAGKIMTRLLLQGYLNEETVILETEKFGKPYHQSIGGKQSVQFNISHSKDKVLGVFSYLPKVGIDIEKTIDFPEYRELARYFFTKKEAEDVEIGNINRFYEYWTAKEAYLKALGIGLNQGMKFFSVRDRKISIEGCVQKDWYLLPVYIKGYIANVAIQEKGEDN